MTQTLNFCPQCGQDLREHPWPKACPNTTCKAIHYRRIEAIVVMVARTPRGVVLVQRGIEPKKFGWALPGGYQEYNETWQAGAARELFEETGLIVPATHVQLVDVITAEAGSGHAMNRIFGMTTLSETELSTLRPCPQEVLAIDFARDVDQFELCFPSHRAVLARVLRG